MLELEHQFRVVDVHARLEPDTEVAIERGHSLSPENLEREMHQAGVVRAVVFSGPRPNRSYLSANNAVARMSVDRPFVTFARINGPITVRSGVVTRLRNFTAKRMDWHTSPADINRYAYDDRFFGFKIHPAIDGFPDEEVLDELDNVGLPVLVHGGESVPPHEIEDILLQRSFPLIIAHFGGYPFNRELVNATVGLLDRYDNCYVDTSHVRERTALERTLREHPDRVLFGSGTPVTHPDVAIMELLTLNVPEDAMKKAFSKNPSRVIEALGPTA